MQTVGACWIIHYHHAFCHLHQKLKQQGRWGTTDDITSSFVIVSNVLRYPLGLVKLQVCSVIGRDNDLSNQPRLECSIVVS